MTDESLQNDSETPRRRPGMPMSRIALLVATLCLLVTTGLWWGRARRERLPEVTAARYDAAVKLWQQLGPPDYDLRVEVEGPQAGIYSAQIRGHLARSVEFNGRRLIGDRTLGTWSVPGMFANIERDLASQERAQTKRDVPNLLLRAEFDEHYGYPRRYQRIDWGGQPAIHWRVLQFEVVPPASETDG